MRSTLRRLISDGSSTVTTQALNRTYQLRSKALVKILTASFGSRLQMRSRPHFSLKLTPRVRWNSLVPQLSLLARKSFGAMIAWRMPFGGIVNRSDRPLLAPEVHLAAKYRHVEAREFAARDCVWGSVCCAFR